MATQVINQFTQFEMTAEELIAGQMLSTNQVMNLTNLRTEYALKKLANTYDPNNHQVFLQTEAEQHGWISCINYILECHEIAQATLLSTNAAQNPESDHDGQ